MTNFKIFNKTLAKFKIFHITRTKLKNLKHKSNETLNHCHNLSHIELIKKKLISLMLFFNCLGIDVVGHLLNFLRQ